MNNAAGDCTELGIVRVRVRVRVTVSDVMIVWLNMHNIAMPNTISFSVTLTDTYMNIQ